MDEQKDANAPTPRAKAAWLGRFVKFESVPVLVLLFALLYSNGYAYLETLNLQLGVPINRLGYDAYQFVVYGGNDILVGLAATLLVIAGGAILAVIMHFIENPDRVVTVKPQPSDTFLHRMGQRFKASYANAREPIKGVLVISLFALATWLTWEMVFSRSIERGKLHAYTEIRDCKPSRLLLKNSDVITACIVGESDDMLYLIDKHTEGREILFQKRSIRKDSLHSTTGFQQVLQQPK